MYIFIDESGDVCNWNKTSKMYSKYFVLAAILIENSATRKKLARVMLNQLRNANSMRSKPLRELKFTKTSRSRREIILKEISKLPLCIYSIVINKETVQNKLFKSNEAACYNWLSKFLISQFKDRICKESFILTDRRFFGKRKKMFNNSIRNTMNNLCPKIPFKSSKHIQHKDSKKDFCIQAADFVAGAIRNNYIHGNDLYFKYIKDKVAVIPLFEFRKWSKTAESETSLD